MDKVEFQNIIRKAGSRETSADPENWSAENPLWGHCAVVSLLAQDYFGGLILRTSLEGTAFAESSSHYKNEKCDFTDGQFLGNTPSNLDYQPKTREYLLSNDNTFLRYTLLKSNFELLLSN